MTAAHPEVLKGARPTRSLLFVLPAIVESSVADEDVLELLLYAAARLDQTDDPEQGLTVKVLANEVVAAGWKRLQAEIKPLAQANCTLALLEQPEVPCIGEDRLQATYRLLEHLSGEAYDEVHYLDHGGLGFYSTQARRLGLAFGSTEFVVHIVGSSMFRAGVEDRPVAGISLLVADLLERESVARADEVVVHDPLAWAWYAGKIDLPEPRCVRFLTRAVPLSIDRQPHADPPDAGHERGRPDALGFYGSLATGAALPLFCDAVDHLMAKACAAEHPFCSIAVVGQPGAVGGIDAASYVRIRQPRWGVPVALHLGLGLADELAILRDQVSVVVCDARRRRSLRSRLLVVAHPTVVTIASAAPLDGAALTTPVALAAAMADAPVRACPSGPINLLQLWNTVHVLPERLATAPSPSLTRTTSGPLVSVCVTHHQRPEKLRVALRSLEAQTYSNIEVIVVDDGSPDVAVQASLSAIEAEVANRGWKVIRQANRYLGAARNTAVRHASGTFLLFMDDDNAAKPNEIEMLVSVQQRTGADVVTCFCDVFEHDADLSSAGPARLRFTPMGSDVALGLVNNCFGDANALWSREAFERLGGFTEDWGITHEDWELFCRAALEGLKLVCVPEPLFWYRIDSVGMSRGPRKQLLENANRLRHLRPYLEKLPYEQAKLAQLAQALAMPESPSIVGERTRSVVDFHDPIGRDSLPFARVVVVMRTKDRPLLLRRAVESVLDQTFGDWLLVIVNDGGDPGVVDLVVASYAELLRDRVIVIHHPFSTGMQTASNAAVMRSASEFIVVHDDDDSWRPTFLARAVSHLDDNAWRSRLGAVVTWSTLITEIIDAARGEIHASSRQLFNQIRSVGLVDMAIENRFPPIAFLFRRAVLETVGAFDESHGPLGDWEFNLRVLARFDIDVIAEPLANYHHRPVTSSGNYGNSVHAEQASHEARRVDLVNGVLRSAREVGTSSALSHAVVAGEFHHQAMLEHKHEFQRLHDYLWHIDQRISNLSRKLEPDRLGRNKLSNGDFRLGCGNTVEIRPPGSPWAYRELTPGISLSYDGTNVVYRTEVRTWAGATSALPIGKSYLRLEKDAGSRHASWFVLQLEVPADVVGGLPLSISGRGRLEAASGWIEVSGRHEMGDGDEIPWATQQTWLGEEFGRFTTVFPPVEAPVARDGRRVVHRVMFRLPMQSEFVLEITDLQVEIGSIASDFEFRPIVSSASRRDRIDRAARAVVARWRAR